ncbi:MULTISPECIES: hypothetical protein [unclassified Pseudoalteromonas]|uniref:lipopolysaccharide biosynthesis protein n=1 Tax=unclassified Pseudoalteromonas TaxID=194690 RepID=UPI000C06EA18|nr:MULTISPECIES: hypothetical protein [unclassified Pseudoalteromonas]MDP2636878.1 hypothetical protein [Pseudoalteromonas sp. 1_MG-2023]PHN88259.1 hypothetical protein CSC79_18905 [Pseudoalteromonas sp. 3D05]
MIKVRGFIVSDILSKGITAAFIPLFAYYMGPSDLAAFGGWFLVFTTVSLFLSLGSPSYFSKKIVDNNDVDEELFLFFILTTIVLLVFIIICFSFKADFTPFLCAYFFVFYQLRLSILRVSNRLYSYCKNNLAFSFLCSIVPFFAYLYFDTWFARVYFYIFITVIFGGGAIWFLLCFRTFIFNYKKLKLFSIDIVKFGLPLSLGGTIFSLRTLFDFSMLEDNGSKDLAASYFLSFQVISIILLLGAILNRTLQPAVFKLIRDEKNYSSLLNNVSIKMLLVLVPLLLFGWFFSLLYSEYDGLYLFFVPMSIGAIVYTIAQLYSSVFLYHTESMGLLLCAVLSSFLHVFSTLVFIFINKVELVGASSLISSMFFVFYIFNLKKKFKNVRA